MAGSTVLFAETLEPAIRYLMMPFLALLGLFFIVAAVGTFATGKSGANIKESALYGHKEYTGFKAYFRGVCFLLMGVGLIWFGVMSAVKGYNILNGS